MPVRVRLCPWSALYFGETDERDKLFDGRPLIGMPWSVRLTIDAIGPCRGAMR
jgi:hypothetical protein